jgi:pimeloyl-ACP methyl ester carboxylesterase
MNSNACFLKWIKGKHLRKLQMPLLVMFGENQFAFSVLSAIKRAKSLICNLELEIVDCAHHLLSVSKSDYINQRVLDFLK